MNTTSDDTKHIQLLEIPLLVNQNAKSVPPGDIAIHSNINDLYDININIIYQGSH